MKTPKAHNEGKDRLERLVRALGKSWARRGTELIRDKDTKREGGIYMVCELQLHTLLEKYRADKRKRSNVLVSRGEQEAKPEK